MTVFIFQDLRFQPLTHSPLLSLRARPPARVVIERAHGNSEITCSLGTRIREELALAALGAVPCTVIHKAKASRKVARRESASGPAVCERTRDEGTARI